MYLGSWCSRVDDCRLLRKIVLPTRGYLRLSAEFHRRTPEIISVDGLLIFIPLSNHLLSWEIILPCTCTFQSFFIYKPSIMQRALTSTSRASIRSSSKLRPLASAGFNAQQLRFAHKVGRSPVSFHCNTYGGCRLMRKVES